MTLAELARSLAERFELGVLTPSAEGVYVLFFDDLQVELHDDRDGFLWLRGAAGVVPEENAETYLREVLQRSFGRVRRQVASLSLDSDGHRLWLHQRAVAAHLRFDDAVETLEQFVNTLEFWKRRLAEEPAPMLPRGPLPFLIR